MQEDDCSGPGLMCVDRGALVGMGRPRLRSRLERTHALCAPCVSRRGFSPSVCGRRTRAELHIQDIRPRMLPSSAAPRRRASCTHPCCSFPCSGLRAHGTLHSPGRGKHLRALCTTNPRSADSYIRMGRRGGWGEKRPFSFYKRIVPGRGTPKDNPGPGR
jgi:hypothetical protein